MSDPDLLCFRVARATDAAAVADLHADSWRRHYRGAFADSFLDGDVGADRTAVWRTRLGATSNSAHTNVAERADAIVGFVHTILDDDPVWGALLDNLHVARDHQRRGIGARLLRTSAQTVVNHSPGSGLYLWVLEQNLVAQAFYQAHGGACVQRDEVSAPGGVSSRLAGRPIRLRYAWPDPQDLLQS